MNPDITIPKWLKVILIVGLQASVLGGLVWYARTTGTNINITSGPGGRHMPPVPRPPPQPPPKKKPKPVKTGPKVDRPAEKATKPEAPGGKATTREDKGAKPETPADKAKNDEKKVPEEKPPIPEDKPGAYGTPKVPGDKP